MGLFIDELSRLGGEDRQNELMKKITSKSCCWKPLSEDEREGRRADEGVGEETLQLDRTLPQIYVCTQQHLSGNACRDVIGTLLSLLTEVEDKTPSLMDPYNITAA